MAFAHRYRLSEQTVLRFIGAACFACGFDLALAPVDKAPNNSSTGLFEHDQATFGGSSLVAKRARQKSGDNVVFQGVSRRYLKMFDPNLMLRFYTPSPVERGWYYLAVMNDENCCNSPVRRIIHLPYKSHVKGWL